MHFHLVAPTTESVVKKTYLSLVIIVCRNNEEKQISWTSAWKGVVMEQIVDIKIQNDDESAQRVRPIYTIYMEHNAARFYRRFRIWPSY